MTLQPCRYRPELVVFTLGQSTFFLSGCAAPSRSFTMLATSIRTWLRVNNLVAE